MSAGRSRPVAHTPARHTKSNTTDARTKPMAKYPLYNTAIRWIYKTISWFGLVVFSIKIQIYRAYYFYLSNILFHVCNCIKRRLQLNKISHIFSVYLFTTILFRSIRMSLQTWLHSNQRWIVHVYILFRLRYTCNKEGSWTNWDQNEGIYGIPTTKKQYH